MRDACWRRWGQGLGLCVAVATCGLAHAQSALDWRLSGFGTVGYAQSNRPYTYQRFINNEGTFKRDSILGAQLDLGLMPGWSATWQVTAGPSLKNDEDLALTTSWAFLSWRPNNDWLVRLGKQRVPMFLYTANRDVGQTYELLRPPAEVYGIAPSTDLTGLSVARNWLTEAGEWTVDLYGGVGDLDVRSYSRDMGAQFIPVRTKAGGAALTLKLDDGSLLRASVYRAHTRTRNGQLMPASYPLTTLPYGMGSYYVVDTSQPGVGTNAIVNDVITLGADVPLTPSWRVMGEVARNIQHRTALGANTVAAYAALLYQTGPWTPYASVARLRSVGNGLDTADALAQTQVSSVLLGSQAALINLSQRVAADSMRVYDQTSVALGTSYSLTARSRLKGEWMRTFVGRRSNMVDSPAGGDTVNHESIDVWSINYNFAF